MRVSWPSEMRHVVAGDLRARAQRGVATRLVARAARRNDDDLVQRALRGLPAGLRHGPRSRWGLLNEEGCVYREVFLNDAFSALHLAARLNALGFRRILARNVPGRGKYDAVFA